MATNFSQCLSNFAVVATLVTAMLVAEISALEYGPFDEAQAPHFVYLVLRIGSCIVTMYGSIVSVLGVAMMARIKHRDETRKTMSPNEILANENFINENAFLGMSTTEYTSSGVERVAAPMRQRMGVYILEGKLRWAFRLFPVSCVVPLVGLAARQANSFGASTLTVAVLTTGTALAAYPIISNGHKIVRVILS